MNMSILLRFRDLEESPPVLVSINRMAINCGFEGWKNRGELDDDVEDTNGENDLGMKDA